MTKKELSQLYYLNKEIAEDRRRLKELETAATNTAANVGGLPHIGSISNKTALAAEIADIKNIIEAKHTLCVAEYNRLTRYINGVDDAIVRQIMKLRFVDGLNWYQVECRIGGNNKWDSLRKKLERYLQIN